MKIIVFLLIRFLGKISAHVKHPLKCHVLLNDIYHKIVFLYLKKYFKMTEKNISNNVQNNYHYTNSGIIWVFWWQGRHYMPLIVQCCIKSIIKHDNGHKVILISKNNINKYSNLPNYIYQKVNEGKITLTHLSDILRFNLLNKYGGLWMDSTLYCVSDLGSAYFKKFYTSGSGGKNVNMGHDFVSDRWTGFLIGGCKHNPIFNFMNIFFQIYWKYNNHQIDYFLIDYALAYIYKRDIGNFTTYVNNIAKYNNPHLHALMNCLNDSFNADEYNKMISDTDLFKLTYKMKFDKSHKSFYYKLISDNKNKVV